MLKITAPYPASLSSTLPRNFDHSFSNLRATLKNNWASNEITERADSSQITPVIPNHLRNNEIKPQKMAKTLNLFAEDPKSLIKSNELPGYRGTLTEEIKTINNNLTSHEHLEQMESFKITQTLLTQKQHQNNGMAQKIITSKTINLYAVNPKLLIAPSEIPGYKRNSREEAKNRMAERMESASVRIQYFYRKHRKHLKKKIELMLGNGKMKMAVFDDFEKFEDNEFGKNDNGVSTLNWGKDKLNLNQTKFKENNKMKINLLDNRNFEIKKDGLSIIDIFARKNMGKFPIVRLLDIKENKTKNKPESNLKSSKVESQINQKLPANNIIQTQSDYYSDDFEEIESSITSSKKQNSSSNKSVSEIVEEFKVKSFFSLK